MAIRLGAEPVGAAAPAGDADATAALAAAAGGATALVTDAPEGGVLAGIADEEVDSTAVFGGGLGGLGSPDGGAPSAAGVWASAPAGAPPARVGSAAGAAAEDEPVTVAGFGLRSIDGASGRRPEGAAPLTTVGAPLAAPTGSSRNGAWRIADSVPE